MKTIRYYLIDATNINFLAALKECNSLHKEACPKNELSITYSNDLTQAIVKVVNDNVANLGNELIKIFTKQEHYQLVDKILNDTNWSEKYRTQEQTNSLILKLESDRENI